MNEIETSDSTTGLEGAITAAMRLQDAISAVALLVHHCWNDGVTADRARNALDWIASAMDADCDTLCRALDTLQSRDLTAGGVA